MKTEKKTFEDILLGIGDISSIENQLSDTESRKELKKEIQFDAVILECTNEGILPVQKDSLTVENWFQACAPQQIAESDTEHDKCISDNEWNQFIDNAFNKNKVDSRITKSRFVKKVIRQFLLAASLILATGTLVFITYFYNKQNRNKLPHFAQKNEFPGISVPEAPLSPALPRMNIPQIPDDTAWSCYNFDGETKAVVNGKCSFKTIFAEDSTIVISLQHGSAEFSVEKKRYKAFIVKTPFSEVRVTGTIFTVNVGKHHSVVGVKEGSVTVSHALNKISLSIKAGESVIANEDTLLTLLEKMVSSPVITPSESLSIRFPDTYGTVSGFSNDKKTLDTYRHILKSLKQNRANSDSVVYSFLNSHPQNYYRFILIELADMYKRKADYLKARQILDDVIINGKDQISETALIKKAHLLVDNLNDTVAAAHALTMYAGNYPKGTFAEDVSYMLFCITERKGKQEKLDSIFHEFMVNYPRHRLTDKVLFKYAHNLQSTRQNPEAALHYYTQIMDLFPNSLLLGEAAQESSNCIVKRALKNRKSRAIFSYKNTQGLMESKEQN